MGNLSMVMLMKGELLIFGMTLWIPWKQMLIIVILLQREVIMEEA